jgi:hypothetical protein
MWIGRPQLIGFISRHWFTPAYGQQQTCRRQTTGSRMLESALNPKQTSLGPLGWPQNSLIALAVSLVGVMLKHAKPRHQDEVKLPL